MKKFVSFVVMVLLSGLLSTCTVSGVPANIPTTQPDDIAYAKCFSSRMVLQRDKLVRIFGTGEDGVQVFVDFAGQRGTTRVLNGQWAVTLQPMEACATGRELTIFSASGRYVLKNVLVGDVWVCSGQSNMAYTPDDFSMWEDPRILAAAENDLLRLSKTEFQTTYDQQTDSYYPSGARTYPWYTGDACADYSAYSVIFAQRLYEVTDVPIGVFQVAMNSSEIAWWVPGGNCYQYGFFPYAGMAVKGVLWYQGENDARFVKDFRKSYPQQFQLFCAGLRTLFEDASLQIYTTQLASYDWTSADWRDMRMLQIQMAQAPEVYLVPNSDYDADFTNIHPATKDRLGVRAAELVLANTYGINGFVKTFPCVSRVKRCADGVVVWFQDLSGALVAQGAVREFRVCGADGIYVDAHAEIIADDCVKVFVPEGMDVTHISYCYSNVTSPNLTDGVNPILNFVKEMGTQ